MATANYDHASYLNVETTCLKCQGKVHEIGLFFGNREVKMFWDIDSNDFQIFNFLLSLSIINAYASTTSHGGHISMSDKTIIVLNR